MKSKLFFDVDFKVNSIFDDIVIERSRVGYYNLPKRDISDILDFVETFDSSIKRIVVIGIGGSSLGTEAIYNFLKPTHRLKREVTFLQTSDPLHISNIINDIDFKSSHFIVVSKSGTTIETIAIFKYIFSKHRDSRSYTFITDRGSKLDRFAKSIESKVFYIPNGVGGRFSVLSPVGLLPLALSGVDIEMLLIGAECIDREFFKRESLSSTIIKKAIFYAQNYSRYGINCIFAYSENLKSFTQWYVQLWAESLGKVQLNSPIRVGLTPVALIGPRDQHSFLQLIMEGKRDKSVTFIRLKEFNRNIKIGDISLESLEELDIINGVDFGSLVDMQSSSTIEALIKEGDIPVDEIVIDRVDAKSIGELIYYYELLTSLVGKLLNVNTYNQQGVEIGKKILKNRLKGI